MKLFGSKKDNSKCFAVAWVTDKTNFLYKMYIVNPSMTVHLPATTLFYDVIFKFVPLAGKHILNYESSFDINHSDKKCGVTGPVIDIFEFFNYELCEMYGEEVMI